MRNPTVVVLERLAGVLGIAAAALLETQTDERAGETPCPQKGANVVAGTEATGPEHPEVVRRMAYEGIGRRTSRFR